MQQIENKNKEKVILVAVQKEELDEAFEYSIEEMKRLVETAQGEVVAVITQKREAYSGRTMVGKGKVEEIAMMVDDLAADIVVFYQSLTGSMAKNLQEQINARIIDRTQLILDIFAMRARSKEGKLQVQLAQMNYLLPRLSGQGSSLSRLGGGIGTRGPGETQLEVDRRVIRKQIRDIERQLEETKKHRERSRMKRKNSRSFQMGLIGYTNAGKSTILNALTDAGTYEENQLFATLDPLTRKIDYPGQYEITLTDTVGFIQDLPTTLIHAFESTLEESKNVDLLIHVVDASAENFLTHEKTVLALLDELEMKEIPIVTIYNKMDQALPRFQASAYPNLQISAKNPADIERLKEFLLTEMKQCMTPYHYALEPYEQAEMIRLQQQTIVESLVYDEETNKYLVKGFEKN
ncbi:GTP-binding protein HflX [Granulicatella balaenopterae]|uniref:GTPase HflX n=1 Tax=Granulicatella balaenopterae TaxID=137733 RepID=A0A1H9GRC0_9LACT|nr:GTPase HflX [Granulicatella balaenopterae]SEQ52538.1 GTP-binding protein HflX [Granulicatella balaenopterae]